MKNGSENWILNLIVSFFLKHHSVYKIICSTWRSCFHKPDLHHYSETLMCPSTTFWSIKKFILPRIQSFQMSHNAWLKIQLATVFFLILGLMFPSRLACRSVTSPPPDNYRFLLHCVCCMSMYMYVCMNKIWWVNIQGVWIVL